MTTAHDGQDSNIDQQASEAPAEGVLTYRCSNHERFFPGEDPRRPYTEFHYDPMTLRLTRESSCRRCASARKRAYDAAKRGIDLTPLERVRREQARVDAQLQRLRDGHPEGNVTAQGLRFQLQHLLEMERQLLLDAGEDLADDTASE